LVQILPRPPDPLQRHAAVEQRLHDLERHEVTERIEPRHPGTPARLLDRRSDQPDLVPIPELPGRAAGETGSLMGGESVQRRTSSVYSAWARAAQEGRAGGEGWSVVDQSSVTMQGAARSRTNAGAHARKCSTSVIGRARSVVASSE